jgi:hypothetical protein
MDIFKHYRDNKYKDIKEVDRIAKNNTGVKHYSCWCCAHWGGRQVWVQLDYSVWHMHEVLYPFS